MNIDLERMTKELERHGVIAPQEPPKPPLRIQSEDIYLHIPPQVGWSLRLETEDYNTFIIFEALGHSLFYKPPYEYVRRDRWPEKPRPGERRKASLKEIMEFMRDKLEEGGFYNWEAWGRLISTELCPKEPLCPKKP